MPIAVFWKSCVIVSITHFLGEHKYKQVAGSSMKPASEEKEWHTNCIIAKCLSLILIVHQTQLLNAYLDEFNVRQRYKALYTIGHSLRFSPTNWLGFTVSSLPQMFTHLSTNQGRRALTSTNEQLSSSLGRQHEPLNSLIQSFTNDSAKLSRRFGGEASSRTLVWLSSLPI